MLRTAHPIFRRQRFFQGRAIHGSSVDDIAWMRPDGRHMRDQDWSNGHSPSVMIYLNGEGIPDRDQLGNRIVDDSFLLLINAGHQQATFTLPDESYGRAWTAVVDTTDPLLASARRRHRQPGARIRTQPRSTLVLRCTVPGRPAGTS